MDALEEGRMIHHRKKQQHLSASPDDQPAAEDDITRDGLACEYDDGVDDERKEHSFSRSKKEPNRALILSRAGLSGVLAIVVYVLARTLSTLAFLRIVTLIPVALSLYAGTRRGQPIQTRIIPLSLVLTVVAAQLPPYLSSALAAVAVMSFSLATIPDTNSSSSTPTTTTSTTTKSPGFVMTLIAVVTMIAVLLTENFLIWVVSATFKPGQNVATAPPPLQDNGERLLKHYLADLTKRQVVGLRRMWNTQWALVACLGASFVVAELFHPVRSLYSVGTRAVLTVATARFIRTVSFMLTVIPSQVRNCYAQRFPSPPPTEWMDWIWVGVMPRKYGGCNDLIISGHAVITSTIACVATSVAEDRVFAFALWSMVFLDYSVEIYEGFHYSVDMWLGIVLVSLLWRVLKPLEGSAEMYSAAVSSPQKRRHFTTRNVIRYAPPAVMAYVQLVFLPQASSNILILLYLFSALLIYFKFVAKETNESRKHFYMHYAQHIMLCLLFMAFGIYL